MNIVSKLLLSISFLHLAPLYAMRAGCTEDIPVQKVAEMQCLLDSPQALKQLSSHLEKSPHDINCIDNNNETIIHIALKKPKLANYFAINNYLLNQNATIFNVKNHSDGDTPAHIIAKNASHFLTLQQHDGYSQIIKLMVNKADFIKTKNNNNKTALALLEETTSTNDYNGLYLDSLINFINTNTEILR